MAVREPERWHRGGTEEAREGSSPQGHGLIISGVHARPPATTQADYRIHQENFRTNPKGNPGKHSWMDSEHAAAVREHLHNVSCLSEQRLRGQMNLTTKDM